MGPKPNFLTPANYIVDKLANESYSVSCQTADGSTTGEWVYLIDGARISTSPDSRIFWSAGDKGLNLTLNAIQKQDSGLYSCVTPFGKLDFYLRVTFPILFDTTFGEQSAVAGRTHVMKCAAKGAGSVNISWTVDSVAPEDISPFAEEPKYEVRTEGSSQSLIINNVTQEDGRKEYICSASDADSKRSEINYQMRIVLLSVKSKPNIIKELAKYYNFAKLGEWANLTCRVEATPPARFQWSFVGDRERVLFPTDKLRFRNDQENQSILQVLVEMEDNFGRYKCSARNQLGQSEMILYLINGSKPPIPVLETDLVVSDGARIRVTRFETSGSVDPDEGGIEEQDEIIEYILMYRKVAQRGSSGPYLNAENSMVFNKRGFIITGLNPKTNYQIRAASKTQASVSDFSEPVTVLTGTDGDWTTEDLASFSDCGTESYVSGNGSCTLHKSYRQTCENDKECGIYADAEYSKVNDRRPKCHEGLCQCDNRFKVYDPERNKCIGKAGSSCTNDRQDDPQPCVDNAECVDENNTRNWTCQCGKDFVKTADGTCRKPYGQSCGRSQNPRLNRNDCMNNLACIEGTCKCEYPIHQIYDRHSGICRSLVSGPCTLQFVTQGSLSSFDSIQDPQKCVQNALCTNKGTHSECECKESYETTSSGYCVPYDAYGKVCYPGYGDPEHRTGLICRNGYYGCLDPFQVYDPTVKECRGLVGSRCNHAEKCVELGTCVPFNDNHGPDEGGICRCITGTSTGNLNRTCSGSD